MDAVAVAFVASTVDDCIRAIAMGIAAYSDIDLVVVPFIMAFMVLVGLEAACYMALCRLEADAQGIHQVGSGSIIASKVVATFHMAVGLACQNWVEGHSTSC